ncbi:peptide ABC transporter substrate-binding protein [Proteus hauseri]|uniref:peptide ABC transporter substrate-binding protein n=1 Tax=Proteus hauseri TaxID=183417 RepID=UPI0032DB1C61
MRKTFVISCILVAQGVFTSQAYTAEIPKGEILDKKQEVVRHIKDDPATLDPTNSVGLAEAQIQRDLFEGLTIKDRHGRAIPGVAQSWRTEDNRIWIFTLRNNAKWSNGEKVTASDFVYSWQRLVDPKNLSPSAWYVSLSSIENAQKIIDGKLKPTALGVEALDEQTLKITLERPVSYFPSLTTHFSLYPVPRHTIEKYGAEWIKVDNLVGNGAFVLNERVVNEKIVLTPNRYYWDHKNTVLTKVTFLPINHESQATKRYLAGDIDITESFPKNLYHKLMKDIPDQVYIPKQLGTYYYAFNTQSGPTSDIRVRKALAMAIDRKIITEKVLGTGEKPANRFTPDVTANFIPEPTIYDEYNQDELDSQAKILLSAAGYGPHNPLKLSLLYNNSENHQKIAIAVASMWKKKLGVKVELRNQEWKTYIDSRNLGDFDVIRASWMGDYNEPSTFLTLLGSKHAGNISKYQNQQYDEILTLSGITIDDNERNRLYNRAEQIIAEDAPIAPIYQYTNGRLIKPWLKGYPIENPEDVAYSHSLYILKH